MFDQLLALIADNTGTLYITTDWGSGKVQALIGGILAITVPAATAFIAAMVKDDRMEARRNGTLR